MTVEVVPVRGLPEVPPGQDLAELLAPPLAALAASDGDVVVVTQKIVSKSEGRLVPAADRKAWVARESAGLVARRGDVVVVRTRHGFVCANAGVDASNVPTGLLSLLPEDPDASAERLQKELAARLHLSTLGVVVTDTFGRPWREGVVDVAIGCAGLPALLDLRGRPDDRGRRLETTVVALADAVAAASGLVMTKTARVPAALVRGLGDAIGDAPPGPARELVRRREDDLFWESAPVALAAGPTDRFGPGDVPAEAIEDAIALAASDPVDGGVLFVVVTSPAARRRLLGDAGATTETLAGASALVVPCVRAPASHRRAPGAGLLRIGSAIKALVVSLHAQGAAWAWDPETAFDAERARRGLALDDEWRPVGVVGVGPAPGGGA